MLFNSLNFWFIFPFVFAIYWTIPSRYNKVRNTFLVLVSYLLYMNWNPAFALALLGVTLVTYYGALIITKTKNKTKALCGAFVVMGLLPLLIFKYYNFVNDSLTGALEMMGLHFSLPGLNWAIPVGISFFTFQAVGYLLDVYHKRVPAEKSLLDYLLFVSFFPQVTSGPISTAKDLMPQIKTQHTFRLEQGITGMKMLLWGMFLKMVLADRIGIYVDTVYANYTHCSGAVCFMASIMYTLQIYCDFAGYSLMAIGIAKTLGFNLINNFERPYLAASVTEFWKRWHISLTRWLTTHVYINLGGNRCSTWRQYWNIMVTFLVSGLWHGANWTFVVWGSMHGLLQITEKAFMGDRIKQELRGQASTLSFARIMRIILTFNLVSIAWIFFRMPTFADAVGMISRFFTDFAPVTLTPMDTVSFVCLGLSLPLLFVYDVLHEYKPECRILTSKSAQCIFYFIITCMIFSIGVLDAGQFIYVTF